MSPDASDKEIRAAYRRLAHEWHPDKHLENVEEAEFRFKEINLAYEVLSDRQNRRLYDLTLEADLNDADFHRAPTEGLEIIEDEAIELDPTLPPPVPGSNKLDEDEGEEPEDNQDEDEEVGALDSKDEVWSPYESPSVPEPDEGGRRVWSGCSYCGSIPARNVNLVQDGAWFVWRTRHHLAAALCRDCGISEFRRLTNLTLIKGWWGPLPFFSNLQALAQNTRERARLRKLVPPAHPMHSDRKLLPPLKPGRPIYLRFGLVMTLILFSLGTYAAIKGEIPGLSEAPHTGASGLVQSHVEGRGSFAGTSLVGDAQSGAYGGPDAMGDPGAIVVEEEDTGGVATMSVFKSYSSDVVADAESVVIVQEDIRAVVRNRLFLEYHAVLIISVSSIHELGELEGTLGIRATSLPHGLPSRRELDKWKDLQLDPRKPLHVISWLKDEQRSATVLYPVLTRGAVEALLSRGNEIPGDARVVILQTPQGNLYLQDFGTHIAISDAPIPLAGGQDLMGPLSTRLQHRTQVFATYDVLLSGSEEQLLLLEELGNIRRLVETEGLPSHGIALLGWTVYGSHKILADHIHQIDEVEFRIGQNGASLTGSATASVLSNSPLHSRLSSMRTHSPVPIVGVSPHAYLVAGLDRTLAKLEEVQSPILTKIDTWITGLVGPVAQSDIGLGAIWNIVEDVVVTLSFDGKSGHTLMVSNSVNDEPLTEVAQGFITSLKERVASRLPAYVAGAPRIRGETWFDMMRELREATRFGLVRADPLDDAPLYALALKVSGSPTARAEGPGFKAFIEAFGGRLRFVVGRYQESFVLGMGANALSEGWVAVQAKDLNHEGIRDLISQAPGNPQFIFWTDFDKLKEALSKLQDPLCGMPFPGTDCVDIDDFDFSGKFGFVAGHEEGRMEVHFDAPYNTIQALSELKRLWQSQVIPSEAGFRAMAKNILGGPRKYALARARKLVRGSRHDTATNKAACLELVRRVCGMCGEQSEVCLRYTSLKRRHCATELSAIDKLIGFGNGGGICTRLNP